VVFPSRRPSYPMQHEEQQPSPPLVLSRPKHQDEAWLRCLSRVSPATIAGGLAPRPSAPCTTKPDEEARHRIRCTGTVTSSCTPRCNIPKCIYSADEHTCRKNTPAHELTVPLIAGCKCITTSSSPSESTQARNPLPRSIPAEGVIRSRYLPISWLFSQRLAERAIRCESGSWKRFCLGAPCSLISEFRRLDHDPSDGGAQPRQRK
jgi:hypothetical protein